MTYTKKLALLASTALLVVAFAIPASASAYTQWTISESGEEYNPAVTEDVYEGSFGWTLIPGSGIKCNTEVGLMVSVQGGSSESEFTKFAIDPSSCEGWGNYANCTVKSTISNVSDWKVEMGSPLPVRAPGKNVFIETTYKSTGSSCAYENLHNRAEFAAGGLELIPTFNSGVITAVSLKGVGTNGIKYNWGPFNKNSELSWEFDIGLK